MAINEKPRGKENEDDLDSSSNAKCGMCDCHTTDGGRRQGRGDDVQGLRQHDDRDRTRRCRRRGNVVADKEVEINAHALEGPLLEGLKAIAPYIAIIGSN